LALGHVTSPVYERESSFGRYGIGIRFDYKIVPPLTRPEAVANEILHKFPPFDQKGKQGTNFPIRDTAIIAELDKILAARLVSLSVGKASRLAVEDSQRSLDSAIKRAKREAANRIHEFIAEMDPTAFEWLIRPLLLKLGYRNVKVTKASGDGGIDLRATLVASGIANIQTCIQVKRTKSVGRPFVQNIRGSLNPHEAGLVITSGSFTEPAIEEAKDPHKVPIALVDGRALTQLLLDHEIGVEHVNVTLYRLKLEGLAQEQLESLVEETDDGDDESVA
jgi:HJR/Mrr/RecB family endonuclease